MELTRNADGALREDLVRHYCRAAELGLNELASGNVSCRLTDTAMLISPAGADAQSINRDTVVEVDFDGVWQGDVRPSSEWKMHAAVYGLHPDARAVVHTHSDSCVALACHNRALPGFHYLVGLFGGEDVPCVPYSTFGSDQLAEEAAGALLDRNACLLANHGMICRAGGLAGAVERAHRLEIMCRQYLLACQLGEPERLSSEQWAECIAQFTRYGYGAARR